jgi:hypothetical protein
MKITKKKHREDRRDEDDSLFGLLSSYKTLVTYIRVLISDEDNKVVVQITDNPKSFSYISERYENFREMRRLEIGTNKLSVKYLSPEYLIKYMGPMLGMKLDSKRATVINNLDKDGYFVLEISLKFLPVVLQNIKRIINLTPQKKYEILEKCLAENVQG